MALTRDDIIEELVTRNKLNRREAVDLYDTFVDTIKRDVEAGKRVKLTGLGAFYLKKAPHRKRRNIEVSEDTPDWRIPTFTAATKFRGRLKYSKVVVARDVD